MSFRTRSSQTRLPQSGCGLRVRDTGPSCGLRLWRSLLHQISSSTFPAPPIRSDTGWPSSSSPACGRRRRPPTTLDPARRAWRVGGQCRQCRSARAKPRRPDAWPVRGVRAAELPAVDAAEECQQRLWQGHRRRGLAIHARRAIGRAARKQRPGRHRPAAGRGRASTGTGGRQCIGAAAGAVPGAVERAVVDTAARWCRRKHGGAAAWSCEELSRDAGSFWIPPRAARLAVPMSPAQGRKFHARRRRKGGDERPGLSASSKRRRAAQAGDRPGDRRIADPRRRVDLRTSTTAEPWPAGAHARHAAYRRHGA